MCSIVVSMLVTTGVLHIFLGLTSIVIGIISTTRNVDIWMAHTVSPIWSGACFIVCGVLGLICAHRSTAYVLLCFMAFSIVSLLTSVISIQLLRLGLVVHTNDGHTFAREELDILVVLALTTAGTECCVSLTSSLMGCYFARQLKKKPKERPVVTKEQLISLRQEQIRQEEEERQRKAEKQSKPSCK